MIDRAIILEQMDRIIKAVACLRAAMESGTPEQEALAREELWTAKAEALEYIEGNHDRTTPRR